MLLSVKLAEVFTKIFHRVIPVFHKVCFSCSLMPLPWKCQGLMGSWATWSSRRCPCLWPGVEMVFKILPIQTFLWFYCTGSSPLISRTCSGHTEREAFWELDLAKEEKHRCRTWLTGKPLFLPVFHKAHQDGSLLTQHILWFYNFIFTDYHIHLLPFQQYLCVPAKPIWTKKSQIVVRLKVIIKKHSNHKCSKSLRCSTSVQQR